jgi:hypothetical protein
VGSIDEVFVFSTALSDVEIYNLSFVSNQYMEESADKEIEIVLELSPNPVQDILNIFIDKSGDFSMDVNLMNSFGKIIYEVPFNTKTGNLEFNFHNLQLKPGLYLLSFYYLGKTKNYKVLKI